MPDTSQITSTTDVITKYNILVKESLGSDSAYIRAKETMQELFSEGDINSTDKAQAISSFLGAVVGTITSTSMSAALEWAKYEKELAIKKLEVDAQLSILTNENLLKEEEIEKIKTQNRLALVESKRMYGTSTFGSDGELLSLTDTGKVFRDMEMVSQNILNSQEERLLIQSKVKESATAIHKVVADTYRNFGNFRFTYDSSGNGISSVERLDSSNTTLSDTQQTIAEEQGKGYTYNAWANALTGSASMLGTAIASGDFDFSAGSGGQRLFETVVNCAENLRQASGSATEATPTSNVSV